MEHLIGITLALIFGAIFGSYSTLFAYRLPRGESCFGRYFGPKSRCPKCESNILTRDLIPLINWVFTKGKCRKCGVKIPRIHFFIEISTAFLFVCTYLDFGFSEKFILVSLIAVALVILLACEYTHNILPYQALNFLLVVGVAHRVLIDQSILPMLLTLGIGILVSVIFYKLIFKKFPQFFIDQKHFFDYVKVLLIASLAMKFNAYLFYLVALSTSFFFLNLAKIIGSRNSRGIGHIFLIPFIWVFCIIPNSVFL